ncbi:hypothetical protein FBU59_002130 [Linderina macrospora]|uniref:Uncharacterized protein n=1 Tax=Linderina macrospora TaxID=4868 RepID=A0ACC1JCB7_9FUNG|nr:hypothetical protein FBU59_002130 [Linderina macrospora]
MKLTIASVVAAFATLATAELDALNSVSSHWNGYTSVINGDMPLIHAVQPTIYRKLTSIFHGTKITQTYEPTFVMAIAYALPDPLMNNILARAGVSGVTVSNHNYPQNSPTYTPGESSEHSSHGPFPTPIVDAPEAYSEISEHWPQVTSIMNEDMSIIKAGAPTLYTKITSAIHGTAITQTYNKPIVDALVTTLPAPIANNLFERAGISDVSVFGGHLYYYPDVDGWSMDTVESNKATSIPTPTPTRSHGHGHGHHH